VPTLLAIETATTSVGVAIVSTDGLRAHLEIVPSRRHTETLAEAISFLARQASIGLTDLAAIAVDIGPGLFTGIRVGVATAAALAYGIGVGVVPVRSTDVVARPVARSADHRGSVAVVLDARRRELYAAVPGLMEPFVASPLQVVATLAGLERDLVLIGEGAPIAAAAAATAGVGHRFTTGPQRPPDPVDLAELALGSLDTAVEPAAVTPLYLRAPDAQITWDTRYGPAADRVPGGAGR
jgi:tRNA threonylcarbamoyladenosine biosynthesis protein TsaB